MSERRYVVELTSKVPAQRLETAAEEVARRLGLDVARVRTLLRDRVGPVTKPVLAPKADAIAAVFLEAGVDVAVYEAEEPGTRTEWDVPAASPVAPGRPAEHAAGARQAPGPVDDGPPWEVPDRAGPESAPVPEREGEPSHEHGAVSGPVAEPVAEPQRVPAPEPGPGPEPGPELMTGPAPGPEPEPTPVVPELAPEPAPRAAGQPAVAGPVTVEPVPGREEDEDPYRDVPQPDLDRWDIEDPWGEVGSWREPETVREPEEPEVRVAVRQTLEEWPLPPLPGEVAPRPGVWVERTPAARLTMRRLLLVALAVAVVLLVALQLVYVGRGAAGATYEEGLAAYRTGDFAAARRAWEGAAEAGSPRAEYMLGYLAQHGLGRPWSYREAAERYGRAAEAGLPEAQLALGELYLEGLGVEADPGEGLAWVQRAASAGHGPALYRLGELYFHGHGAPQDFDAALAAFAAAAERGSGPARDFLALAAHLQASVSGR